MRILFSPVGGNDPVSMNKREKKITDGSMLHIVRKYNPDKVYMFLTREMIDNMQSDIRKGLCDSNGNVVDRYTLALKTFNPKIDIEYLKHDIAAPNFISELKPLIDDFHNVIDKHVNDEIFVNVSSGTPQMKAVLVLLCMEKSFPKIVQVSTPADGENRNRKEESENPWKEWIEHENVDNAPNYRDRCSRPDVSFIKQRNILSDIRTLALDYEYEQALRIFNKNGKILGDDYNSIKLLLEYAKLHSKLQLDQANSIRGTLVEEIEKEVGYDVLSDENRKLVDFFMLLELNLKKKELSEFIVKITPMLYEIVMLKFKENFDGNELSDNFNGGMNAIISLTKLKKFPKLYEALKKVPEYGGKFKEGTHFTFYNMLIMLSTIDKCKVFVETLRPLRKIESDYRHPLAHTITNVTELNLLMSKPHFDSGEILNRIRSGLKMVLMMGSEVNLYDVINNKLCAIVKNPRKFIDCIEKSPIKSVVDYAELKKQIKEAENYVGKTGKVIGKNIVFNDRKSYKIKNSQNEGNMVRIRDFEVLPNGEIRMIAK